MGQNLAAQTALEVGGGVGFLSLDAAGNLKVVQAESPVVTTTPLVSSSGHVAAGNATATLVAAAGKTTYISGLSLTGGGATAASVVEATVTGLAGGNMTLVMPVPAGVANLTTPVSLTFDPPLPASAPDVAIVVNMPSLGSGNTNAAANAWGFQK
jgi:hypothetical protein